MWSRALDGIFAEKHLPHRPFFLDDLARNLFDLLECLTLWFTLAPQIGNLDHAAGAAPERGDAQAGRHELERPCPPADR